MHRAGDLLEGRYELEAQLGQGGTALVFRACDLVTKATVAIKVMEAGREQDPEAVAYFSQEGRLAARIRDPHLVPALHFGVDEGRHFIVYDYLPGTRPLSALSELGPVAPRRVCEMALQVLYALDTLHRAGVVHGDVSLNNCLWRERDGGRDEVRLCDLGCAWARSPSSVVTGGPTEVSDSRGSAYCTAPEILNDEAGDHRADLWSVGAIVYALMTMRDVDLGDPEEPLELKPPASLVPTIPKDISDVVMRALAPAEQRYPSAAAMVEAIRAALATPSTKRGLPLWASVAGMALTAGLATVGSLVSMADAHGDAGLESAAGRDDMAASSTSNSTGPSSSVPPGGDEVVPQRQPETVPAGDEVTPPPPPEPETSSSVPVGGDEVTPQPPPEPTVEANHTNAPKVAPASAPTSGVGRTARLTKPFIPHPEPLTWSVVEKVVTRKAGALRPCSSDEYISLGLRVADGRATLETLDGDRPSLPRDRCAVDVVTRLRFAKSDDPLVGVVGVKLPDSP